MKPMSLEEQLETARRIAVAKHAGQTDKQGKPYIDHPFRVADAMQDPGLKVVALLHDTIEDTGTNAQELISAGIDPVYVKMVCTLTRDKRISYHDYIRSLLSHPEVIPVKLADIRDNLRPGCPPSLKKRYLEALRILGQDPSEYLPDQ